MDRPDSTTARYNRLSITLHWFMVLLLVAVYLCIELRGLFPKGSDPREALKAWHFMLGLSVLVFVLPRLGARFAAPPPGITPAPARWTQLSAGVLHFALYLLMIGMPLSGWLILSAAGKPIPFFGLELPALIAKSKDLSKAIETVHETAGDAGYFLAGLHTAVALYHHYIVRDNTLVRMLSGRK